MFDNYVMIYIKEKGWILKRNMCQCGGEANKREELLGMALGVSEVSWHEWLKVKIWRNELNLVW